MELKRNLSLAAYLSARKTYLQRKRRNLQARRVCRKRRSLWVINGRTDQWWQNMIGEDVPDWCWRKIFLILGVFSWSPLFHWNRFSFLAAAISFPGKQNHCTCPSSLFSPGWNFMSITWDFFSSSGPFGRAENPSSVWKTGLGFLARAELRPGLNPSPCNQQFDFKRICFRSRDEISARLAGLKFAM